jgi:hypothetical protein
MYVIYISGWKSILNTSQRNQEVVLGLYIKPAEQVERQGRRIEDLAATAQ